MAAMRVLIPGAGICAPDPRTVRCSNGGECKEHHAKYEYCLQGRCVDCIARGSCGTNRICSDGICVVEKRQSSSCNG
jgi:hypothetical protein